MARGGRRAALPRRRYRPGHRRAVARRSAAIYRRRSHAIIALSGARRSSGGTHGADVALNPPPAASGALIAFGLGYVQALAEHGRSSTRSRCWRRWERPTRRGPSTGRALRSGSPTACWHASMRECRAPSRGLSRHHPYQRHRRSTATPPPQASPTARATASSSAISASC